MSRHDKIFYSKLLLLFLGIVSLLIFFYTIKLRDVIEQNILFNINEIAQHDKRAIRTCIELFLDELSGVEKRLAAQGGDSLRELETRLNLESSTTPFKRLFMLAEDGRIFTDKFLIYTPGQGGIGGRFDFRHLFSGNDRKELVLRFDDNAEFAGISRESILYAIKLEDFSVAGLRMTALIGFTDISFLQEHLIIESFVRNDRAYGFSSVIDMNGNYIVGRTRDIYLRNDTNFFTQLAASRSSSLTKREIVGRMARREDFSLYLEDGDGKKLVYFVPFINQAGPHLDWYFLIMVNNDFLVARQATFTLMGLSLLVLVVLLLTLFMLYGIFSRNRLHMANESVRVRSEFLSNMSHEIRTPLNGLIGLNHLIASHVEERDRLPQIRDWLGKSRSLAEYLLALLNDILDMSKLQAGKIDIVNARFSITDMIADVIFMQTANAEKNGLLLSLEENVPVPWVLGDATRLKQILVNIIGNAAKFTPSGGSITVTVHQERTDERHVRTIYRCRDTGRGMSRAFLQKLFDPFTRTRRRSSMPRSRARAWACPSPGSLCGQWAAASRWRAKKASAAPSLSASLPRSRIRARPLREPPGRPGCPPPDRTPLPAPCPLRRRSRAGAGSSWPKTRSSMRNFSWNCSRTRAFPWSMPKTARRRWISSARPPWGNLPSSSWTCRCRSWTAARPRRPSARWTGRTRPRSSFMPARPTPSRKTWTRRSPAAWTTSSPSP